MFMQEKLNLVLEKAWNSIPGLKTTQPEMIGRYFFEVPMSLILQDSS